MCTGFGDKRRYKNSSSYDKLLNLLPDKNPSSTKLKRIGLTLVMNRGGFLLFPDSFIF